MVFLTNKYILTSELYYNSLGEQLALQKITEIIEQKEKYAWVGYVFLPIVYLIKFTLMSLVLFSGFYFFEIKAKFSQIFKVAMLSEFPFLLLALFKFYWFFVIQTKYELNDLQYFSPASLLQFFDIKQLENWQIYPLQLISIFELSYWVLLVYWIKEFSLASVKIGINILLSSYLPALLIWIAFITFLTLNFT
jgi:hypothetical protein